LVKDPDAGSRLRHLEHVRHQLEEARAGRDRDAGPLLLASDELVHVLLVDPEEDLVLAREVVIERRLADAGRRGDVSHAGVVVASGVEQLGRLPDYLASLLGRAGARLAARASGDDRSVPGVSAHVSG